MEASRDLLSQKRLVASRLFAAPDLRFEPELTVLGRHRFGQFKLLLVAGALLTVSGAHPPMSSVLLISLTCLLLIQVNAPLFFVLAVAPAISPVFKQRSPEVLAVGSPAGFEPSMKPYEVFAILYLARFLV